MDLITILIIILLIGAIGGAPVWPHSKSWGYYPSGGVGLLVIVLLILFLTGHRF